MFVLCFVCRTSVQCIVDFQENISTGYCCVVCRTSVVYCCVAVFQENITRDKADWEQQKLHERQLLEHEREDLEARKLALEKQEVSQPFYLSAILYMF